MRDGLKKEKAKKVIDSDSDSDDSYGNEDEPAQEPAKDNAEKDKPKQGK